MGAEEFTQEASGRSVKEAFRYAVDQALFLHGHGGYTGTIAEKTEVKLLATVDSMQEAYEKAYDLLEDEDSPVSDKWGPAGAIRVSKTQTGICFLA